MHSHHGDPAHRVLSISEILSFICQYSSKSTLASLVRVNKALKETALPSLWHTQEGLVPLALCFGEAITEEMEPVISQFGVRLGSKGVLVSSISLVCHLNIA